MSGKASAGAGVFALIAAVGLDGGGYAATAWGWSATGLLALLAVLLALGVGLPGKPALVLVAGLVALVVWTAASIAWSSHVSASVLDVQRTLLYASAASVLVLARSGTALLGGVLAAVTLLCGYALTEVREGERLTEPVGYANGLAILAVLGLLLATGFAARASAKGAAEAAAATTPLLAATLYFTYGRGAWAALGVGLAVAIAVGPRRLHLALTAVGLAVPAALAVLAADRLATSAAFAVLAVLSIVAALVPLLLRYAEPRYRPSPRTRTAFAAVLIALPVAIAAAVIVRLGGPEGVYDAFRATPAPTHGDVRARVFSLSGRNRADYWSVAWGSYQDHPGLGRGAGTFARTWLRERPVPQPVTDAHSLYLETLAELGPVGLALLLLALAAPLTARRTRWTPIALGPYAAYLAHAAQDWGWELPVVTVAALACGAALIGGQTERRVPRLAAVVPALACLVVALAFAGNRALEQSADAVDRLAWREAEQQAERARSLQPWSPEPWRLLGEIELTEGSLAAAQRHFRRGLEEDPDEFELWIGLGLASDGAARREAFSRAAQLNPLSPELRELGFETD